VRVVGEVEAGLRVGRAPAGVDLERADFPVCRDGTDQEEQCDQGREEEQKSTATATPFLFGALGRQAGKAHLRSTLTPSDYEVCFAPRSLAETCYKPVTAARSGLARRPAEAAATEEMEVEVIYGLPGLRAVVENQPVTISGDLSLVGDPVRGRDQA